MSDPNAHERIHLCYGCVHHSVCATRLASQNLRRFTVLECEVYAPHEGEEDRRWPFCPDCRGWGYHDDNGDPAGAAEWHRPCKTCGTLGRVRTEEVNG